MSPDPPARDRRQLLLAPGALLNGIDYIDVGPSQTRLSAHFLNTVTVKGSLSGSHPVTITGGEIVTAIVVNPIDEATAWSADSQGRPVLALTVAAPGDISTYGLTISSGKLDPFFDQAQFTFQVTDPTLDPAPPGPSCPEPAREQVPIDYLAKDFASFQQALSEFSAQRYPAWVERSEADLGVMLMEALAALADELSYYQDRVSAESAIGTATQRLSVVRQARLVDYEPAPATVATTVLQLDVAPPPAGSPPAGSPPAGTPATGWTIDTRTPLLVRALGADGSVVDFEIEDPAVGLAGAVSPSPPAWAAVDTRWNRASLMPYYWDDSRRCLLAGSTDFYVVGHGLGLYPGQQLLLDSPAASSADPPVRELVTVAATEETADPLIGEPPPTSLTRIFLQAPTTDEHDLNGTAVAGNIVPAVQGLRQGETFVIPDPATVPPGPVVVRIGANWTPQDPLPDYRYCLASGPLAWLATPAGDEDTSVPAQPEILLSSGIQAGGGEPSWAYQSWLLDAAPADQVYTLTPEQYSPVLTSNGTTWFDYDGDGGTTIRFGDGTFGVSPLPGTVFSVLYRVGVGSLGNVAADTVVNVAGQGHGPMISSCTNPFPAAGGADAETILQIRNRAAQMFSAEPLQVVQAGDYVAAVQSLPWVQQAATTFRWTGSWLTVLTHADPAGTEEPTIAQLESLTGLLDQRRLAGYESYVLPPSYVSIDLKITVAGKPGFFGSDVAAAVLARLQPGSLPGGPAGFFDHSLWSFGEPLESSALLAAIQTCTGVDGVRQVQYREGGAQLDWAALPETLTVASGEILRIDNDPARPEAGSLQVTAEGSK